jgi:hypothetical protein
MISEMGDVFSLRTGVFLKGTKNKDGYIRVSVGSGRVNTKKKFIHNLVLETFIGSKPCGKNVNHTNGVKDDNRLENLEYVTESQNIQHSYDSLNRTRVSGERNGHAKFTNEEIKKIRKMKSDGCSTREIYNIYGRATIGAYRKIVGNRTYKDII